MTTTWKTLVAVAVTNPPQLQHLLHRYTVTPLFCPSHKSGRRSPLPPSTRTTPSSTGTASFTLTRCRYLRLRLQDQRRDRSRRRLPLPPFSRHRSPRPLHLPPTTRLISSS